MRRLRSGCLALALALASAPPRWAQEPPSPPPAPAGDQKEQKDEQKQGEQKHDDPAPAPAGDENKPLPEDKPSDAPGAGDVQGPPSPAEPVTPAPESAAPSPARILRPLDCDAIAQHLRNIAATYPAVALLETIGRSAQGREILALRLSDRTNPAPAETPVLLLVDFEGLSSVGPEAALELAWSLAERFEKDEAVHELLHHATLVIAPALDPDGRVSAPERSGGVFFDRNFPSGWQPETLRSGAGRVSLSQSESLAAARFLANLKQAAVVLGFGPPTPAATPYPESELPSEDRGVFARLAAALAIDGAAPVVPWYELGSPGGGFFDFAYQARGIYPLVIPLPSEEELAAGRLPAFSAEVGERTRRCLALLPRMEIVQEGLERLAGDTWQLDVRFQNAGLVPTLSALARRREPGSDVSLRLEGAKLVATAKKPTQGASYTDASFQVRSPLAGGTLAGGEGRWLRLILEASSGAEVHVTAGSLWAGTDVLSVTLP